MASPSSGRLLEYALAEPSWNMALDQALLESTSQAAEAGVGCRPTLRFYGWSHPTLSLGYFQQHANASPRFDHIARVRRATGGGAILHHHELTYSLCVPLGHRESERRMALYRDVHQVIIDTLDELLIRARLYRDECTRSGCQEREKSPEPFLCFQRRTDEDLICCGYKIVGSAQRRTRYAVLQHGSILLNTSCLAAELPGLRQLTGRGVEPQPLAERITRRLEKTFQLRFSVAQPEDQEETRAETIRRDRFASESWWLRR